MSAFGTVMKAGKVALAIWGVVASVRHLGKVLVELRGQRYDYFVDAANLPSEKVEEYLAEAGRHLAKHQER